MPNWLPLIITTYSAYTCNILKNVENNNRDVTIRVWISMNIVRLFQLLGIATEMKAVYEFKK